MATHELLYPKGDEVGFKVPANHVDTFTDVMSLLKGEDKFIAFEAINDSHVQIGELTDSVVKSNFSYKSPQHGIMHVKLYREQFCDYVDNMLRCEPISFWENRGYIEHEGKLYESAESLTALRLEGFLRDKFSQVIDWCEEVGLAFVSFSVNDDNCIMLNIDGHETEPMGSGDYLIQVPGGLEVHTKESLIEEGYIFSNDDDAI
ncbi:MAG: hypothetical protein RSE18_00305 [Acinetobacter sp.]